MGLISFQHSKVFFAQGVCMNSMEKIGLHVPSILLPKQDVDMTRWSVVACDQYTSEKQYWESLDTLVGDAPSTLRMILPEVYLEEEDNKERILQTQKKMKEYLEVDLFDEHQGFLLVERQLPAVKGEENQPARYGLIVALDLEQYDYSSGSQSLIRATEGTILERLPPRMNIRRGAPLELPHILVLIDDPHMTVIEPFAAVKQHLAQMYDFYLNKNGGHISGYLLDQPIQHQQVTHALGELASPDSFYAKYPVEPDLHKVLLYAMGDGNHSLATAKAIWEELKPTVDMHHPARYALVELENIHSPALTFEAIHRLITEPRENFLTAFQSFTPHTQTPFDNYDTLIEYLIQETPDNKQRFGFLSHHEYIGIEIQEPTKNLAVGTLQEFLDQWKKQGGFDAIDYIHGDDVLDELAQKPKNLGFYLPAMKKSELFTTVILDGALPRKTFSMGEAHEKRYYLECRKLV
jgi:hypothetical protein